MSLALHCEFCILNKWKYKETRKIEVFYDVIFSGREVPDVCKCRKQLPPWHNVISQQTWLFIQYRC